MEIASCSTSTGTLADIVGNGQLALPSATGLELWLELRHAIAPWVLEFDIWVEVGGICRDMQSIGPMYEGCAERDRRGVSDPEMKVFGRWEDAIAGRIVGDGVADDLANLDATDLM